jgi:hypothetical protein
MFSRFVYQLKNYRNLDLVDKTFVRGKVGFLLGTTSAVGFFTHWVVTDFRNNLNIPKLKEMSTPEAIIKVNLHNLNYIGAAGMIGAFAGMTTPVGPCVLIGGILYEYKRHEYAREHHLDLSEIPKFDFEAYKQNPDGYTYHEAQRRNDKGSLNTSKIYDNCTQHVKLASSLEQDKSKFIRWKY